MAFIDRMVSTALSVVAGIVLGMCFSGEANAAGPRNWEMGFQPAASPTAEEIHWFNGVILLPIIVAIVVFVMGLLVYVMWRFSEKRNPTPSKTTHNTAIEVLWTALPVMILIVIAIPSFKLLYFADRVQNADMTLKAIGHQWYWSYQYPDQGGFEFDATLIPEKDLKPGQKWLLDADNPVVLPVDTNIRLLVTASDVIHSFALPAMGIKLDAVPGRINETWLRINEEGTYYGQCSELCGTGHAYMPITVKAVSKAAFKQWVAKAKTEFSAAEPAGEDVPVAKAAGAVQPAAKQTALAGD